MTRHARAGPPGTEGFSRYRRYYLHSIASARVPTFDQSIDAECMARSEAFNRAGNWEAFWGAT
jgi:hypothetical protein